MPDVKETQEAQPQAPAAPEAAPSATDLLVARLMQEIDRLRTQVEQKAGPTNLPPPPAPRGQAPFIMVWKDPYSCVRMETTEEAAAEWRAKGSQPIKAWKHHSDTVLTK